MQARGRGAPGILGGFGNFSGLVGIGIVAVSALFGAVITIGLQRDPGTALGVLVIIGTLIAGLAVRARSARLLIPAPTLCYLVAAAIAGAVNDRSSDTSHFAYLVHSASWIAGGFLAMTIATLIAVVITFLRLYLAAHNQRRRPSSRPPRGPADRYRESPRDLDPNGYPGGQTAPVQPPYGSTGPMGPTGPTGPVRRPDTGPYPTPHPTPPPGPYGSGPYPSPPRDPGRQGQSGPYGTRQPGSGPYPPPPPGRQLPPGKQLPPGQGDRYNFSSGA